jgi:glycerophosphoryl diester phosphodiesterase
LSLWATYPLVVGHRGGRGPGWPPENTIDAFDHARRLGARAIELDVRVCYGGILVVFHDDTLARMTRGARGQRVEDLWLDDLRAIDLGGGSIIPTLNEVLEWARDRDVAVNVELKHDVPDRRHLARTACQHIRTSRADVCLSSFDPSLLAMAAVHAPGVRRALLVHEEQSRWAHRLQEIVRPPLAAALHLERTQARPGALARYARRGLRVGVWTVNDALEAALMVQHGAKTIITDDPGAVLPALSPRS